MFARFKAWLAALVVALVAITAAWLRGRGQGRADTKARQDKAYRDTIERAKDADLSRGYADADRRWLRDRGKR